MCSHLSGQGCPDCGGSKKPSTLEFIRKAKIIYDNKDYTYGKVDYINAHTKVVVTCKHHGDFTVKPNAVLSRSTGCPTCSKESQGLKNTIKFDQFLSRAAKVHGDKYIYNESSYTSITNKVEVNCLIHGSFHQLGVDHINGHGCKKCGMSLNGFSKTNFINICNKNNKGIGKLYVIQCFNDNELFFKIGITSRSVNLRFAGKFMPYQYETEFVVIGDASAIYDLETQVHRFLKKHKYSPDLKFKGSVFECFSKITPQVRSLLKKMCENDQQLLIA